MKLFDMHTHILPRVDDGARDLETALEMIRFAAEHQTRAIVLTPHVLIEEKEDFLRQMERNIRRFDDLTQASKGLGVALYFGGEVYVSPYMMEEGIRLSLPTLNKSRYLLTEFPSYFPEHSYVRVFYDLLDAGYIPLIAHPERYGVVLQKPEIVEEWTRLGCRVQITADSLMGGFGRGIKNLTEQLLKRGLVSCVGSDAHNTRDRHANLLPAYQRITSLVSAEYAEKLMCLNPRKILTDTVL